jgi:oxygen-independent coproporphyrinogen-3 oxidase
VGVQSLDDHVLGVLGRRHDAEAALRACRYVIEAGMVLSVDLICGVPGQSAASWSDTVTRAATTGAHHASVYPLSIEEGTPLAAAVSTDLLEEPDSDVAAEMMLLAEQALGYYGLARYEVANYAESETYRSVHNLAYWTGHPYMGIGPGAHGMLDVATAVAAGLVRGDVGDAARVRYGNAPGVDEWLTGHGDTLELLNAEEVAREDVMLGLRLTRGVPDGQVTGAGVTPVLEGLERDGLVEHVDGYWRTTQRGWLLGNEVFGRVWLG